MKWCNAIGGNVRHQQVAASVRQAASRCGRGLFVVATDAAQQTEDVEGHDQDNHAEHCHTADPPASHTNTQTLIIITCGSLQLFNLI